MDGSVSRQPQKRGILASGTLWWFRCRIRSREHRSKQPRPDNQNAPYPPTQRLAHSNTLPVVRAPCRCCVTVSEKPLPPRLLSPGPRQDTAKTRPSHMNRSKELDPLRHRRPVLPKLSVLPSPPVSALPPSHPAHCKLLSRSPLPIEQKPGL